MIKRAMMMVAVAMLAGLAATASAGPGGPPDRGSGGWGNGDQYGRRFDPRQVVTLRGEITAIHRFTPMRGMGAGVHVTLRTDRGPVDVHLGPAWYLEAQDADLKVGDRVEVRGSRVQWGRQAAVVAIAVRRGHEVLTLRDDDGFPRWAGWRRGGPRRGW